MIILRHLLCCQFLSPWFGLVGWQLGLLRQLPSQASTFIHAPPKVKVWRSKQCKFSTKANCQHELPSFNPLCFDFRQSQISTLNHKGELVCFGVEIWNFVPKIWNYCVFGVTWKWCWCQNDKYHVCVGLNTKISKELRCLHNAHLKGGRWSPEYWWRGHRQWQPVPQQLKRLISLKSK